MVKCSAPWCENATYRKTPEITFHRFPKDEKMKIAWLSKMKRQNWQPTSASVLCSKHFEAHLIDSSGFRTVLAPGAIPTIFDSLQETIAPTDSDNVLRDVCNVQPSTSTSTLSQQDIIPTSTLKGPTKRSATGHNILPAMQNVMLSNAPCQYNITTVPLKCVLKESPQENSVFLDVPNIQPTFEVSPQFTIPTSTITSEGQVLREIQNVQPGLSRDFFNTKPTSSITSEGQVLPEIQNVKPGSSRDFFDGNDCLEMATDEDNRRKEEIKKIKNKTILKNKKIKALKQQNRRLKNKVSKFSEIISSLKEKLNQDDFQIISGMKIKNKDFFVRYLKKAKSSSISKTFSPELRSFALQLNFYSPRAYNFVRDSFNTILPHPATLSRWYKKIDAEPGFTAESFETLEALAKNSKYEVLVNLSLDEMAIRKGLVWDGTANKFRGYVDTGTNVSDDSLPLATQALVLLVTAINFNWILPIAYFFINSMTGEQRANIVKMAIQMLKDINIFVCGLTFDGAASNISMAIHLGCNFNLNNLKPYFFYENRRINVFYDPCHMIKLIRNTLGEFGSLIDKDGGVINFKYLSLLLELQTDKRLHLGNKLKQAHILFGKQKMKVRLAVQLLSKSVADALSFCEEKFDQFKGSKPTIKFINIINDSFDVLNSRSTLAPGHKKALCNANIQNVKELTATWQDYLMNLKLPNGNFIVNSARKTGFVGFIVCLHSALNMYEDLVSKGKLRFLTVYKTSQDFLEMFFGKMRARGGFNDNPNVVQFRSAYKKNIIRLKLKMQSDGFIIPNTILTVTSSEKAVDTVNNTTPSFEKNIMDQYNINEDDIECFLDDILGNPLDDYTHHVTIYIAGFIARKVNKVINCSVCQMLMLGEKENFFNSLISKKDRGGLIYPSNGLIKIVQSCEKILKMFKENTNYTGMMMYIAESSNYCADLKTNDDHDFNHLHLLIRVIVKFYIDLRMKHDAKETNLSDRNYLKKIILFRNK